MGCLRRISDDLLWVGGNDRRLRLFENAYPIPDGMSYNAYLILDEKTALMDTVDAAVSDQFFENLEEGLGGRALEYVVVSHMEPDHCGALKELCLRYPDVTVVTNDKAFAMIRQFFGDDMPMGNTLAVAEGSALSLGRHRLTFYMAPMVHWPEVMVAFDGTTGTLFSADAFGSFGALDGSLFADEIGPGRGLPDEMRRYYSNIVGKYGGPVQALLKKASALDVKMICPLHGPIWRNSLSAILKQYQTWSTYTPETEGALVVYASVYGHTALAAQTLARELALAGAEEARVFDVSQTHPSYLVSEAFRLGRLAFLSTTYNAGIFPAMETLLLDIKAHALKNRVVGLVENGSWAPVAGKLMKTLLADMKGIRIVEPLVSIRSALGRGQEDELRALARAMMAPL